MKKIDKLITTSFIGPSILSYFVATFVLVMQFLWKYIDEILGRGFSIFEILELIFYYAVTLIPLAVPITMLISSVMVFGDMSEKYELSSMKSAGISLLRIILPSLVIATIVGLFSIFASNYLKPAANLQFQKRFLNIRQQKSALALEEGIFNDAFYETIIRIDKIDDDGRNIHDILIYDHTQNDKSLVSVTSAKAGEMFSAEEGKYFVMQLDSGVQYKEFDRKQKLNSTSYETPFMRTYYDQWTKTFDMSQFDANDGILNFNRNKEDMLNTFQLAKSIDSFNTAIAINVNAINTKLDAILNGKSLTSSTTADPRTSADYERLKVNSQFIKQTKDTLPTQVAEIRDSNLTAAIAIDTSAIADSSLVYKSADYAYFVLGLDSLNRREVLAKAQTSLARDRDEIMSLNTTNLDSNRQNQKYLLRLNQQYSWGMICIIFLLIGAPLGSIIRKGGYGYPLLVAILFYMIFIITTIFGEKLVKNEVMGGMQAAWLPCILLAPFALVLTFVALKDIKISPVATIKTFFANRFPRKVSPKP